LYKTVAWKFLSVYYTCSRESSAQNGMSLFWRQIVAGEEYCGITSLKKKQVLTCEMDIND